MATRRNLLLSAGGGAAMLSAPSVFASQKGNPSEGVASKGVFIYDSRNQTSLRMAQTARNSGMQLLDVSREEAARWQGVRRLARESRAVAGMTGWSSWVLLRGFLEEGGKRVVEERRIDAGPTLFFWRMAPTGRPQSI